MFGGMRKKSVNHLALDQRLALTINSCAEALDCGRTKIYDLIHAGKLKVVDVNGMTRVTADSLRALVSGHQSVT
jgi:excisionase family DNA binding protein